mmetsp:Transcript_17415/g.29197  ORF Transcript_17415/g.29197 Transcript_17415/m.29197 type:complete len:372 (+) Transcript_17415:178-1293(+)
MAALSQLEADEAFARELQAQENGHGGRFIQMGPVRIQQSPYRAPPSANDQEEGADDTTQNPTVLNTRLNQLSTARATVVAIVVMHAPQIIATIAVLSHYWGDTDPCDALHRNRWKWWALINAVRMFMYTYTVCYMHIFKDWLREHHAALHRVTNIRNITDATGLIWFVVGNMWIFGDNTCHHQLDSPVYNLCLSMLIISYVQICLPCILAAMLIPVFCFCMPCLIRVLASIQESSKGATEEAIEAIPTTTLTEDSELIRNGDNTCPICLSDMVTGDTVRILPCKHFFHNTCVDEWLKVNATCPTCRKSILPSGDVESGEGQSSGVSSSDAPSSSSAAPHSNRSVLQTQDDEEEKHDDNYENLDNESVPLCP